MELDAIRRLLTEGRYGEAKTALDAALAADPDDAMLRSHRAALAVKIEPPDAARSRLLDARDHAGQAGDAGAEAFAELWLGFLGNQLDQPSEAIGHFERSAALEPPSPELCGVLCQTYMVVGDRARAVHWGARSLALRRTQGTCRDEEKVRPVRPRAFDPAAPERNVIAFTLFGADAYYHECAITVARMARAIFPEFTCRFFCAQDIPDRVRRLLIRNRATVVMVEDHAGENAHPFQPLLWRFLAFDDPEVDLVIVRDVDSPFTLRERIVIDHWLAGEAPFLTIRDHPKHTEPMMAGMWAGFTGLLPRLGPIVERYRPPGDSRFIDQWFLRHVVWPRVRDATLEIDSVYRTEGSEPFPPAADIPGSLAVGSAWTRPQILGADADEP